jgi:hypothetical protein
MHLSPGDVYYMKCVGHGTVRPARRFRTQDVSLLASTSCREH